MPQITLPDGSLLSFDNPVTVREIATKIAPSLAKVAVASRVNGRLVDLSYVVKDDIQLAILTDKDPQSLDVLRHSCAHLLAQAVKALYPQAQVTIGPVIADGFYYDFSYERPFTPEDIEKIETKMRELAKANMEITRRELSRNDAIAYFLGLGEKYKAEIIQSIPEGEVLSLYKQGEFEDLCRGPHLPFTGKIKAFKLTKLAGAYWRGDAKNEMLQRIYGTAWMNDVDLKAYLFQVEEAEKRDHRKIGKALKLFHFQEEAPGMPFWHPNGWTIYQILQNYISGHLKNFGYQEVRTPMIIDKSLWERSGHIPIFSADMFFTETENREYAIKPMNCPAHIQIFNQGLRSYRDLPLRLAEFGVCHRCESSGSLHGLMRVRSMVQDDGHIFCTEDQIQSEAMGAIEFINTVYPDFGFDDIIYKLATRPDDKVGSDEIWDKAEKALADALDSKGLKWTEAKGDGAFYGPKIEFHLKDSIGRTWQCGTVQLDFSMPMRLDATYVAEDNTKKTPVMIHRAILGTFERFMGMLIEHYAGFFPAWLAPVQVVILNITDRQADYAREIEKNLKNNGFRVVTDLRNEKIGFKIREHALLRVPYLLVLGDRELENQMVAVRTREGVDKGVMSLSDFEKMLKEDILKLGRNKPLV
jgi:threonyl-tRNA synthetase